MAAQNQNNQRAQTRKMTTWGVLKWVLYSLAMIGIIASTFIVAVLTD
jgi:hypothetical protein